MKSLQQSFSTNYLRSIDNSHDLYEPKGYKFQVTPTNSDSLKNPFPETKPLKFKKDKHVRRQTAMNVLQETQQLHHVSSIRTFSKSNESKVFDTPSPKKKLKHQGVFSRWGKQSSDFQSPYILNRSFEDLGINRNRRNLGKNRINHPDPILIGEKQESIRPYLEKIEKQARRRRDNGTRIKQNLLWEKVKPKTYLQKFRATRRINTQAH